MSQLNIKKTGTFAIPPSESLAYSFNSNGDPVYVKGDGSVIKFSDLIQNNEDQLTPNILVNNIFNLSSELPLPAVEGTIYITLDNNLINIGNGAGLYEQSYLLINQFVSNSISEPYALYQFNGSNLAEVGSSGDFLPLTGGELTGALTATTYYGDGSHLTGIATSVSLQSAYDENPDYPTIVTSEAGGLMVQNGSGVDDSSAYILAGFDSSGAITTTITASGRIVASEYYGDGSNLTGIETGGFQVVNVSGDTLCENNTIYFVDTVLGGVQVVMTLPQATAENFQVRIYKYSAIDSKDVFITSVSDINDLTFQIVQGEDEGLWIVSDGTDYHIVEDNRGLVQSKLARSSGAITPCTVTKNIDNTINLGAFIYFIEDASDLKAPVSKAIKFSGVSNYALTNLGTCGTTIIYIDSNQNLIQLTNVVTPDTYWSNPIRVGIAVHTQGNGTVDFVFPFLMPAQNPGARLSAFQTVVGCVKSGISLSATPATLQLVTGSGTMFIPGVQSVSYPLSPDSSEIAAHNPLTTISYYTSSSRLANKTLFDPTSYNSAGTTITTIPSNNNAVIHHVYCDILGQISVQYGQRFYSTLTAAISAHLEGQDSFNENPIFNSLAVKIGYIIATKNCTNLLDTTKCKIITTDKFGSTGGGQASASVVDLQRAYDNSVQPQITTSTTKGALQIKNGALANTTDSFEIQNISGVKVFGVNGLGLTTDSITATTYNGITTSMVANTSTLIGNTVTDVFNNATVSTDGIVLYTTDMIAGVREEVINGTTVKVNKFWSGTLFTKPKLFTVFDKDTPLATDDYNIFVPDTNITITKVYFKTKATTVTFNINHSSNIDIWTADKQATTTLQLSDVINNPNCLAGMPIKYQASAIGATPTNIHVTIYYTEG